ncbi:hypothetical protein KCV03_g102, partial [Aureobasidium melanogenum]
MVTDVDRLLNVGDAKLRSFRMLAIVDNNLMLDHGIASNARVYTYAQSRLTRFEVFVFGLHSVPYVNHTVPLPCWGLLRPDTESSDVLLVSQYIACIDLQLEDHRDVSDMLLSGHALFQIRLCLVDLLNPLDFAFWAQSTSTSGPQLRRLLYENHDLGDYAYFVTIARLLARRRPCVSYSVFQFSKLVHQLIRSFQIIRGTCARTAEKAKADLSRQQRLHTANEVAQYTARMVSKASSWVPKPPCCDISRNFQPIEPVTKAKKTQSAALRQPSDVGKRTAVTGWTNLAYFPRLWVALASNHDPGLRFKTINERDTYWQRPRTLDRTRRMGNHTDAATLGSTSIDEIAASRIARSCSKEVTSRSTEDTFRSSADTRVFKRLVFKFEVRRKKTSDQADMNLRERIDAYIDVPQDIRVWVCRFYIDSSPARFIVSDIPLKSSFSGVFVNIHRSSLNQPVTTGTSFGITAAVFFTQLLFTHF